MLEFLSALHVPSITVIAPAVAAVIGIVASLTNSFLARREVRTKLIEADYHSRRLEVIQRALAVQETLGDYRLPSDGIQALKDEYLLVVEAVRRRSEEQAKPAPPPPRMQRRSGVGSLILPRPMTLSGWLATPIYYFYAAVTAAYLIYAVVAAANVLGFRDMLDFIVMGTLVSALVAGAAHRWALASWDNKAAQLVRA